MEFEDGAQINVGFAGAGFHLHGEVAGRERRGRAETIAELDGLEVSVDFVVQQLQAVADAQVALGERERLLGVEVAVGDGEFGAADFLTPEQVADGFDGGVLVVKVRFKVEFHGLPSKLINHIVTKFSLLNALLNFIFRLLFSKALVIVDNPYWGCSKPYIFNNSLPA